MTDEELEYARAKEASEIAALICEIALAFFLLSALGFSFF